MTRRTLRFATLPLAAMLLAACSSAGATATPTAPPTPTATAAASESPSPSASASASASASESASAAPTVAASCMKGSVKTLADGKFTIGTDSPAYPPYFLPPTAGGKYTSPWKAPLGDPYSGEGFEDAVAYAVAAQLGFAKQDVTWAYVPFDNSYKPGAKPFDFYLAQVSYTPDRAQVVDMSDGYYFVNQSVVALKGTPIANAKSIADLKPYKLGAQSGTTAYTTIKNTIAPSGTVSVYQSNDAAILALKAKQTDGIVVDLPTAFYITSAQLDNSVIVGQFAVDQGSNPEHFSLVLAKGSPLTACVNQAIAALKANGTLDQITKTWLSDKASAPILQP